MSELPAILVIPEIWTNFFTLNEVVNVFNVFHLVTLIFLVHFRNLNIKKIKISSVPNYLYLKTVRKDTILIKSIAFWCLIISILGGDLHFCTKIISPECFEMNE